MKSFADQLLEHMKVCTRCRTSIATRTPSRCPVKTELVRKTTKERHG